MGEVKYKKTTDQIWDGIMLYGWDKKRFEKEIKSHCDCREQIVKAFEGIKFKEPLPDINALGFNNGIDRCIKITKEK